MKESLASSYGEISPGSAPLIYANLPVSHRLNKRKRPNPPVKTETIVTIE